MIELLIADVDGTLVTHEKELTERARRAVRKLHDASIAFAVTSGRPPRGMSMLVEPLAITTPIAGFNGGMFVHPDMTPIEREVAAAPKSSPRSCASSSSAASTSGSTRATTGSCARSTRRT